MAAASRLTTYAERPYDLYIRDTVLDFKTEDVVTVVIKKVVVCVRVLYACSSLAPGSWIEKMRPDSRITIASRARRRETTVRHREVRRLKKEPLAAATAEPVIISTYAIVHHASELCFHSGYSIHRLYAPEAFELDPEATVEIVGGLHCD